MAAKTFIPALVSLLHKVCVYIARYRPIIETFLPEGGGAKLNAIVVACEAFMTIVPDNSAP